jgi:predicted polyphosphate/ATP-dependent NAD kinase
VAAPIGLIANPASGKDIRRLVAHASVFDNGEKRNILRRVILGAVAAGASEFLFMPDAQGLAERAADGLAAPACLIPAAVPGAASALDSIHAAAWMREAGCAVIVTLGGDGTNRAVALGWRDAPLIPISTGTNNVFPAMLEGTVAGAAAGLIASGAVALDHVAPQAKRIHVAIDGEADDLALIDAVLLDGAFTGARALWEPERLRLAVLTRAEPAAVGVAAIGGLLDPVAAPEDHGLRVEFGRGGVVLRAPVAPGLYRCVEVARATRLALGEAITIAGPGMLALDGERERTLRRGRTATLRVLRDGPRVVDVRATLAVAARRGIFLAHHAEERRDPRAPRCP